MKRGRQGPYRSFAVIAFILLTATVFAYLPALKAGFIWDDDDYVTHNPVLRSVEGLGRIWLEPKSLPQYYPLVHTTYWIEYRFWKLDPFGYHLVNVLLHGLGAVLLFLILKRLNVPLPFLAAAIFALHPVQVESVAWITERKNTLSGVFYFLALLAWLRWRPLDDDAGAKRGPARYYVLSLAAFACALFSKTVTCSLPAVILLLLWWKHGRIDRSSLLATLPMFAAGFAMAIVTARMEVEHVAASGASWDFTFIERCLIAGRALWFYVAKLFLPIDLTFNYARWDIDASLWRAYLYPLLFLIALVILWALRRRIGRGPLAAVLIFSGTLFPALGFFNTYPMVYSFVADHFQYLACIALIVLFCGLADGAIKRRFSGRARIPVVSGLILLHLLGFLTIRQARIYENLETLWLHTLEKNPRSWLALGNLGGLRFDQGRYGEARPLLERALEIKEPNPYAHNNLGMVLLQTGDMDGARKHFEIAMKQRPDYGQIYNNLGVLLWRQGDLQAAEERFSKAVELIPDYIDALRNLAQLHAERGEIQKAIPRALAVLNANPKDLDMRFLLANMLRMERRYEEALSHYQEVLRVRPDIAEARVGAAHVMKGAGQVEPAIRMLAPALQSTRVKKRVKEEALGLMAELLAALPLPEDPVQAVRMIEGTCASLRKSMPEILENLAALLEREGRRALAREAERRARDLRASIGR